jgi:hypothetical protein
MENIEDKLASYQVLTIQIIEWAKEQERGLASGEASFPVGLDTQHGCRAKTVYPKKRAYRPGYPPWRGCD